MLISIARTIGLNVDKFQKGLKSGAKKKVVLDGRDLAKSYGAKSTPAVILDGNIFIKDNSLANVSSVINKILEGKVK